jgi:hypothetical protein
MRARWIPLVALLALVGCSVPKPKPGPAWDVSAPDDRVVHRASGLSFPAHLPGLDRGGTRVFDESGTNASVAYGGSDFLLEITVFVYPRSLVPGGTPESHFGAALSDIRHHHPAARLERSGPMQLPLSAEKVDGMIAFLTFVDQGKDLGSWLIVLPDGEYMVKVRATYERSDDEATAGRRVRQSFGAVQSVLQSIERRPPPE